MSDFFIPKTNENDYWTQKKKNLEEKQKTAQINNDDYWKQKAEPVIQQKKEHYENWNRYGVDVPDEYYEVFNKMIPKNGTPEEAQEEAYKIGSAYKYMQMMGCSFEEAYKNVDAWNEAQFTDLQGQKPRYEALSDMITMGNNNVKLGRLGQQLMQAHLNNDQELADALMAQIDAINQRNVLLQDNTPRKWFMEMLEAGAQSLPFTGYIAGAGLIGNFIAPAVGTGAAFAASSYLSAGQEYIDMLANGATPQTARIIATVSGGIQGLIEADLGLTKGIVKGAAKTMGKEVSEDFARKTLEKIGQKVFKRFHFGAGKKLLLNYLAEYGMNVLGEGVEEFLQEITSIASQEIAASIDGYNIPDDDFKSIVSQTTEAFRGGILGALALGFVPAGLNTKASVKNYRSIKEAAETVESPEVFYEEVKENPVFGDMTENTKKNVSRQIWEEAQARKEEAIETEARKIAEGRDVAEGAEESPEENEDGTTESNPVARNEAGRLITQDKVFTDDDGNTTGGTFLVGDTSKNEEEDNRYGYIKYTADEKGDITITDFKMKENREGLRAEVFDEFAREHPDVNIEWNAIGSNMKEAKQALIEANPSGAKNGLNYYTSTDLDNVAARKMAMKEIRSNIFNYKKNADGTFTKTELSNKQLAAAVTLIESAARRMNMGLADYINKTFGSHIFGSREEFTQATLAQGEDVNTKAGGMRQGVAQANWREVGQQVKAVIYAGEHADFSTWTHEMAHVFQNQLDGDLKTEAESAFNVVDGDWVNSTYTFKDGRTMSSAEAFAYGFQDWLETGKAENEQMKNIFQKFAQFIADAYNKLRKHLDFTPEIESVFNKLLDGDDTIMSKALKAAQEEEGEYRATLQRQAEEKEAQKKAEAEEAKRQAQAEREEASEGTDFEEEEIEQSAEEIEKKLDEVTDEKTPENNAIDDALENTNLTDEKKAEIAEVLKDETSTQVDKAKAITEAASSVYENEQEVIPPDMFFQKDEIAQEIDEVIKYVDSGKNEKFEKEAVYKNTENNRKLYEITYDKDGNLIPLSKRFDEKSPSILFQTVFHGSPHVIRRPGGDVVRDEELGFDHSKMGTGEGAQAYGWGTYVTQVEGIAKNYASKLGKMPYTQEENERLAKINEIYSAPSRLNISIESKKDFLKARRSNLKDLDNGKYEARINKNIKEFTKELKAAKKENDEDNIKFYEDLINTSIEDLEPKRKEELRKSFQKDVDNTLIEIEELKKKHKEAAKILEKQLPDLQKEMNEIQTAAKARPAENVYTLDIPDEDKGNYIPWDEHLSVEQFRAIYKQAKKENLENFVDHLMEDVVLNDDTFTPPTGEWLYKQDFKFDKLTDKEKSLFLNRAGITGISYPAQYLSGGREDNAKNYVLFNENDIKVTDWHAKNAEGNILFQQVFHGSGADFDKFDTENFGLSGEGSMSFGYGTYVTDSEEIARDYAERQADNHAQLIRNAIIDVKSKLSGELSERAKYTYEKELEDLEEKLRIAESSKPAVKIALEVLKANNFDAEKAKKDFENDTDPIYRLVYEYLNKYSYKELESMTGRNLYTVEIPNDGYLDWEKEYNAEDLAKIKEAMKTVTPEETPYTSGNKWHYANPKKNTLTGATVYETIANYLGSPKAASNFLHSIGYAGIKYPAGTIHGNGNGAYNYVIFNDDDAQIVDHLLFQTQAELADEARGFDSWQEFMDYCETFHADDDVSPIPGDADAQWYQSFWEISRGVETEQEKNEKTVKEKYEKEDTIAGALDAYFSTEVKTKPEILDNFLNEVARIDAIDIDSDEWQRVENTEDAAERDNIDRLKDFINITLSDYNWQTALKRIQGGHEIAEGLRKRLVGEMTDSFKTRDFRALYAEVMNDQQYEVSEEDSITATLNKKLRKYHDIVKPTDDISRWSPEKRKQLAEQLQNREIAAKIKNGSLKLDDELDAYIKSLTKQIKEKQKQLDELDIETKADYQRFADAEVRTLLKLHDELLIARGKVTSKDSDINRKIAKGLKITEKYRLESQNLTANYDELFRKFYDLKNSIRITAEVQAALDRQEQVAGLKEDLNSKQKEKNLTAEIKKMRIQLVKRAMRRVPFSRIDYNSAKTVIAIQRMLEPNLLGGVNRFIGIDSPYLRGIISQIVTDSDYKERIMYYLSRNSKSSQAFMDFKKKLSELKNIKDFDRWTAKDRKAAIRYLPKENWVRDLNLKELAKEREESIDLDIGMEEVKRTVYDEKTGEPKTYKDKDGNDHNVTETAFRLQYKEELGQLVKDAVGADMFDKIINMPFSEWTTEDLEQLAQRIDEIYTEGRTLKAAKDEARRKAADAIRKRIEDTIKETGITINDDDTPEEKERKQKQINETLGMSSDLKGTEAGKTKGFKARLNRLLHSYSDMNVMRVSRMFDNQSEGENYRLLYRMEDDCYNAKQRNIARRTEIVYKVMADNKITIGDLTKVIKVPELGTEFTVDDFIFFLAADKDYAEDEKKLAAGFMGLDANDDYAATSRNAVMFGNIMSDMISQEEKERWVQLNKQMEEAIKNDTLSTEQKQLLTIGQLDRKPGTSAYIATCHAKWLACLSAANSFIAEHPEYKALIDVIEADYASSFERMNEVSINEFNMPVHRVKAYVPLVRRESNGDTNVNQVKEDLLGAYGAESGKQWVNKGMTQRRVTMDPLNQNPVQTGLFRTWADSVERTEHFIAYAPYVRQLNAVYKSRDAAYTRRFIEARYGRSALEYLDSYINEVANPNAGRIRERGAEWLHVLRGKTAPAYLGWKASAIIKQGLTSPWPYMQFVNPAEYLSAAMKFTFNPQMREAIKEKSVFMKMRRMDPVNDLIDEMADNAKTKLDRGWSNFSKIGMQGLEMIDWACVAPGWLACYEKKYNQLQNASEARYKAKMEELKERNMYADVGTSEYLSPQQMEAEARREMTEDIETEAVRYADDCTRACQPSNRVTDLAPLFKNSSEAMKAFLQFQTSLNVIWQNIRYDIPYAVKQKEFKRIAGTIIGYVMAGIFMNSVMDGIGGDDDDDETQALKNLIYYSTTQFTDAIPIMGSEITNTMDQLITGKRGYASSGTDMTPSATKLLSVLTNAKKGNWTKAAELTAEGIGLYLGAPVSGAKEVYKLLGKPLDEGDVNLLRGISDVYGLAGDIIEK